MKEARQAGRVLGQFVKEARSNLATIEQALAGDPTKVGEPEQLQRLFRAFHSIKGISGYANADEIGELSHQAESLLKAIQGGQRALDTGARDLLLIVHDELVVMLEATESGGSALPGWQDTLAKLRALVGAAEPAAEQRADDAGSFVDVVRQQLAGLDLYLKQVTRGPCEPRLKSALLRKLRLIRRSAVSAGHSAVEVAAGELLSWFEAAVELAPEQVEELQARVEEIARLVAALAHAPGGRDTGSETGRPGPPAADQDPLVPIRSSRLHQLSAQIEELVVSHTRLAHQLDELTQELPGVEVRLRGIRTEFESAVAALERTTHRIQMVELAVLFDRVPRMVRQIAREGDKQIALTIHGADTEVDRAIVDLLGDPLTHIVKNAIDHGIEPREQREALGKPDGGVLNIHAYAMGKHVFIDISDDGKGIDPELIRVKAVEKGYLTPFEARHMKDAELLDVIYAPGYSSRDEVTRVSGRGVGMDAVLQRIQEMGGQVTIKSEVGVGTTIRLILPNSFALMSCLVVRCGEHLFAVPIRFVKETLRVDARKVEQRGALRWVRHKGELRRLRPLEAALEGFERGTAGHRRHAFVMTAIGREILFDVDELVAVSTLSIRSLPAYLESRRALAGVAIVGGGRIAFFLHTLAIVEAFARRDGPTPDGEQGHEESARS